ncbi:MAG: endospore germination permease, partial [Halanaerobium sp.]|nr:endospore germination permease [Halanaerobium sp.]
GWLGGLILLRIYLAIARLHPGKNYFQILTSLFGKWVGGGLGLLHIWYFLHLASLVSRNFGEFFITADYPDTPMVFIIVAIMVVLTFSLKKGIEVISRTSEMLVPLLILLAFLIFFLLIPQYDLNNLQPVLASRIESVLSRSFSVLTFPFGELVVFLVIFPLLREEEHLFKTGYLAWLIGGILLLLITVRDLLVLGPDMFAKTLFPPLYSTRLMPFTSFFNIDPLISVDLLIGGGTKIIILIFGVFTGLANIFKLGENKALITPVAALVISISVWIYSNTMEMVQWAANIYPIYAIPFQIIIPGLVLLFSLLRPARS